MDNLSLYETLTHKDPNFPIIFHLDTLHRMRAHFPTHWHESLELLYMVEGSGIVSSDGVQAEAKTGDIVIFNSNVIHSIEALSERCRYYCLIVDKAFCDNFGIPIGEITIKQVIFDHTAAESFDRIVSEMMSAHMFYKEAVKAESLNLLVHLCRHYQQNAQSRITGNTNRVLMVKNAVQYIRSHFAETLTVDDVCVAVGFSKYYFCREFKALTGRTVVDYINFLRCSNARILMASGRYNVSESAERSGFHNLSYFSKIYKKQMGVLPSEDDLNFEDSPSGF